MVSNDSFNINNSYMSSNDNQTKLLFFCDSLIKFNKPIYYIPSHIIAAVLIGVWRDHASSNLDKMARRVTCSLVLGALSILGTVDTAARLALALFKILISSKKEASAYLSSASMGLQHSLYFATCMQLFNLYQKKLVPSIFLKI